jgi:hypothetical protein
MDMKLNMRLATAKAAVASAKLTLSEILKDKEDLAYLLGLDRPDNIPLFNLFLGVKSLEKYDIDLFTSFFGQEELLRVAASKLLAYSYPPDGIWDVRHPKHFYKRFLEWDDFYSCASDIASLRDLETFIISNEFLDCLKWQLWILPQQLPSNLIAKAFETAGVPIGFELIEKVVWQRCQQLPKPFWKLSGAFFRNSNSEERHPWLEFLGGQELQIH